VVQGATCPSRRKVRATWQDVAFHTHTHRASSLLQPQCAKLPQSRQPCLFPLAILLLPPLLWPRLQAYLFLKFVAISFLAFFDLSWGPSPACSFSSVVPNHRLGALKKQKSGAAGVVQWLASPCARPRIPAPALQTEKQKSSL
jgi:hypothetical protein